MTEPMRKAPVQMAFSELQRAAVEHGATDALSWTLHNGSRSQGVPWSVVMPKSGSVVYLSPQRNETERMILAFTRLFRAMAS